MVITLKEIDKYNLREAVKLKVAADQESFVAPNAYSVAQSKFYPTWIPLGIYDGESMVGFLMCGKDEEGDGAYWIIRLMIDEKFQGRGLGRAAMEEIIRQLHSLPDCGDIYLGYEPQNQAAASLYRSLGFEETGLIDHGEIVVRLPFKPAGENNNKPDKAEDSFWLKRRLEQTIVSSPNNTVQNNSQRDPLTGLFSREYMAETLERELARAARNVTTLGMILIDLDHFQKFNEIYGSEAGDIVLTAVGRILQASIRMEDLACRYGADEFLLLLPDAPLKVVYNRAQQVQAKIKELQIVQEDTPASIGVVIYPHHGLNGKDLLCSVEAALSMAKAAGGDQVIVKS